MRFQHLRTFFVLSFLPSALAAAAPFATSHLTFPDTDTSSQITINVYGDPDWMSGEAVQVILQMDAEAPIERECQVRNFPKIPRRFCHLNFTGLDHRVTYAYWVKNSTGMTLPPRKFKTIPQSARVKFVQGGDMGIRAEARKIMKVAADKSPQVALIGGDIAYADGELSNHKKWDQWLKNWYEVMVTPAGFEIPLILAIGNHEVNGGGGFKDPRKAAPFFFRLFPQTAGDRAYFKRKIGGALELWVLDSGHSTPQIGKQLRWLKQSLRHSVNPLGIRMAMYHAPMYPSVRTYFRQESILQRWFWQPQFDQYRVQVVFENHDHTLKRTHRIRDNKIVKYGGTIYLGDGAFGAYGRDPEPGRWYNKKIMAGLNFWLGEWMGTHLQMTAYGDEGQELDSVKITQF